MASTECASLPPSCPAQHMKALLQDEADGLYRVCKPSTGLLRQRAGLQQQWEGSNSPPWAASGKGPGSG